MIGGWCLLVRVLVPAQVVALCQAPFLLDDPNVGLIFPADAIARAKHYLSLAPGGLGNIIFSSSQNPSLLFYTTTNPRCFKVFFMH